ncbi:MAG: hypothetical protein ACJAS1_006369, partial [Oleiphilaceae bacterium]
MNNVNNTADTNDDFKTFIDTLDTGIDFLNITSVTYVDDSELYVGAITTHGLEASAAKGTFSYTYGVEFGFQYSQELLIDLGTEAEAFGVSLFAQSINVAAGLAFTLQFGVAYDDTSAPEVKLLSGDGAYDHATNDDFFIAITNTQATVSAGVDLSDERIDFGFFEAAVGGDVETDNIKLDVIIVATVNEGLQYKPFVNDELTFTPEISTD